MGELGLGSDGKFYLGISSFTFDGVDGRSRFHGYEIDIHNETEAGWRLEFQKFYWQERRRLNIYAEARGAISSRPRPWDYFGTCIRLPDAKAMDAHALCSPAPVLIVHRMIEANRTLVDVHLSTRFGTLGAVIRAGRNGGAVLPWAVRRSV